MMMKRCDWFVYFLNTTMMSNTPMFAKNDAAATTIVTQYTRWSLTGDADDALLALKSACIVPTLAIRVPWGCA